ncbi:DUF2523 domain-containing protein [Gammaproteobacteria bacterium]|nr:DUF2523 domain-containing protein [Gammaproteobacteria bacterium]
MPLLLPAIYTFLVSMFSRVGVWMLAWFWYSLPAITIGVVTALGLGVVTYAGLDYGLSVAVDMLNDKFANRPAQYIDLMAYLGVDDAIKTITGSMAVAITLKTTSKAAKWSVLAMPPGRI